MYTSAAVAGEYVLPSEESATAAAAAASKESLGLDDAVSDSEAAAGAVGGDHNPQFAEAPITATAAAGGDGDFMGFTLSTSAAVAGVQIAN
jgi:hypothetical protein